jgi:hypothetical protein
MFVLQAAILHTSTTPFRVHGMTLQLMVVTYELVCYGIREGSIPIYRSKWAMDNMTSVHAPEW